MGWACSMYGREVHKKFWWENLKKGDHQEKT
jgi:hypothetical protein